MIQRLTPCRLRKQNNAPASVASSRCRSNAEIAEFLGNTRTDYFLAISAVSKYNQKSRQALDLRQFADFLRYFLPRRSPLRMTAQIVNQDSDWSALLEASRAGDDEAFGKICARLTDYLMLTANCQLNGVLSAKFGASDIVQQALLEAQQDFSSFQGTSENEFRAWLVRLLQHNLIDSVRSFRKAEKRNTARELPFGVGDREDGIPGSQKTASSIVQRRETDDQLLRAVAQLPARRRQLIELRHWQGLSFAEVGRKLDISEVAARNLWVRTIEELRKRIAVDHAPQPT